MCMYLKIVLQVRYIVGICMYSIINSIDALL